MINHVSHQKPILAAVLLNANDDPVINSARYLARKLHAPLHLVHAVRPMFSYVGAGDIVVNPYFGHEVDYNEREEREARQKLEGLQAAFDDVEIITHLVRDFPSEAISSLAEEVDAGLLVCGVDVHASEGSFLSGTSTAYVLASEAEVPVLLIPQNKGVRFEGPLRVLIADNLEVEGECALESAILLANELHAESLTHMHVQDMSLQDVDKMIDSVRESMVLGKIPSDPDLNRDFYIEKVKARTQNELLRRYEEGARGLNSTRYEAKVAFGKAADEIHSEVERANLQLMVFGRHHLVHRKSLSLGRIPYSAMAMQGVAALVVPDHKSVPLQKNVDRRLLAQGTGSFLNHHHV